MAACIFCLPCESMMTGWRAPMKRTRPHSSCKWLPAYNWMEQLWVEQKKNRRKQTGSYLVWRALVPPPHRDCLQDEQKDLLTGCFLKTQQELLQLLSLHTQQPGCSQSRAVTAVLVRVLPTITPSGHSMTRKIVHFHFKELLKSSTHLKDLGFIHFFQ